LGLQKGDRIGIWGPNSYEWFLTHFAGMKAGLAVVSLSKDFQQALSPSKDGLLLPLAKICFAGKYQPCLPNKRNIILPKQSRNKVPRNI